MRSNEVDPHLVFYALLPPLLYESAAGLSWHVFRRVVAPLAMTQRQEHDFLKFPTNINRSV
eukprot:5550998-Amphidinium_carterae.1